MLLVSSESSRTNTSFEPSAPPQVSLLLLYVSFTLRSSSIATLPSVPDTDQVPSRYESARIASANDSSSKLRYASKPTSELLSRDHVPFSVSSVICWAPEHPDSANASTATTRIAGMVIRFIKSSISN